MLIVIFFVGTVFGLVRARTSTTVSALVHGLYDAVLILLAVAAAGCSAPSAEQPAATASPQGSTVTSTSVEAPAEMSPEACQTRVRAMVDRESARVRAAQAAAKAKGPRNPVFPIRPMDADVPVPERGSQAIVESGYRLYLPADGPIRFPVVDDRDFLVDAARLPPLVADTPYPDAQIDAKIASDLARALDRASSLSMRDSAHEPLYIVAESRADVARLAQVLAVVPTSMAPRLVVRRPASALVAEHVVRAPFSPPWVRARIAEVVTGREWGLAAVVDDIARASGATRAADESWPCQLREVIGLIAESGSVGLDTVLAATAEALPVCGCRGVDVDALESLLMFIFEPHQWHGYLDLRVAGTPLPAVGKPGVKTIADLARALAEP